MMRQLQKAFKSCQRLVSAKALLQGTAPAFEHEALIRQIPLTTLVDVGANRGQFSLLTRIFWPQCEIIAFEPLAVAAAKYKRLFKDDARVRLIQAAVGAERSRASMHVSRRDDSSSLLAIGEEQLRFAPGTDEIRREMVDVGPLEVFITPGDISGVSLLKIDVQGYEDTVLAGAESLLSCFSYVYCELSFRKLYEGQKLAFEVIERLHGQQFKIHTVNNISVDADGVPVQADFLFNKGC